MFPGQSKRNIPSFSLAFILGLRDYLLYSNDAGFVREYLPVAERIVQTVESRISENGLVPRFSGEGFWNFYEWEAGLDGSTDFETEIFDAPLNEYFSMALDSMENIYKILGYEEKAESAGKLRDILNRNIDVNFWSEEKQAYCTYITSDGKILHFSQLAQALAVCSGACPVEKTGIVLNTMLTGGLIPVTLSCRMFKYEALLKMPDKYGKYVFEDIAEVWGRMLFSGATSFWETERGAWDFDRAGSLCHGWSAIPAYFYFAYALGLKPKSDCSGFEICSVDNGIVAAKGRFLKRDKSVIELG